MSTRGDRRAIPIEGGFMFERRLPSPAVVIAVVALFVSLGGTAVAATVVPLAKRALSADKARVSDNAKKLGGKSAAQLTSEAAAKAGPASSASGLMTVRTSAVNLSAGQVAPATVACAAGEKASGGGFVVGSGVPLMIASGPNGDGSGWTVSLLNLSDSEGASGTAQVICMR
jgi:hypothetical protein